jgi:hypothetical protein
MSIEKYLETKQIAYDRAIKTDNGEYISIGNIIKEYADQFKPKPISHEEIEKLAEQEIPLNEQYKNDDYYLSILKYARRQWSYGIKYALENFNKCDELNAGKEQWISVDERLPNEGETVAIELKNGNYHYDHFLESGNIEKWFTNGSENDKVYYLDAVSHWIPLPTNKPSNH